MTQVKIGSSIKAIDRKGVEHFYTVENIKGDIGLFQRGELKRKRRRTDKNTFLLFKETYMIVEDIPNLNTLNIEEL